MIGEPVNERTGGGTAAGYSFGFRHGRSSASHSPHEWPITHSGNTGIKSNSLNILVSFNILEIVTSTLTGGFRQSGGTLPATLLAVRTSPHCPERSEAASRHVSQGSVEIRRRINPPCPATALGLSGCRGRELFGPNAWKPAGLELRQSRASHPCRSGGLPGCPRS